MPSALYRAFLRLGNSAVEHRFPQKHVLRHVLRSRFRDPASPEPEKIANTLQFFKAAAESNGLERRCLHTMIHVESSRYSRQRQYATKPVRFRRDEKILNFNDGFYATLINGLNETQKMCL